jgi:Tol biopolymer transport system component
MPDTHGDIRRRLFDAAWEVPAYAPAPERTVPRARRRAALTISGGVAALSAAAVAIVLAIGSVPSVDGDRTAVDGSGEPREYLVDVTTGETMVFEDLPREAWMYDISPDGSQIAFVADPSGRNQVWIMNLDGSGSRQVTHDRLEAVDPDWSPDGSHIAYAGFGSGTARGLFVVDVATGKSRLVKRLAENPWNPMWSPDGGRIVFWSNVAGEGRGDPSVTMTFPTIRSVDVTTQRVRVLAGGGPKGAWDGAWSRSGRIAFIGARYDGDGDAHGYGLWTMNDDGSEKKLSFPMPVGDATSPAWSPDGNKVAYILSLRGRYFVHVFDFATGEDRQVAGGEFADWTDDGTLLVQEFLPEH